MAQPERYEEDLREDLIPMPKIVAEFLQQPKHRPENEVLILIRIVSCSRLNRTDRDMFRAIFPGVYNRFQPISRVPIEIDCLVQRFDEEDIEEDKAAREEAEEVIKETEEFMASKSDQPDAKPATTVEDEFRSNLDVMMELTKGNSSIQGIILALSLSLTLPVLTSPLLSEERPREMYLVIKELAKHNLEMIEKVEASEFITDERVANLCQQIRALMSDYEKAFEQTH